MTKDALTLKYDKPVDRIAARLLWKSKDFQALPEKTRTNLVIEPPRIKPEDVTYIFDKPPRTREKQQPVDHRGEQWGVYFVLGYAGARQAYERSLELHGGRNPRCGVNKSGLYRSNQCWRGHRQDVHQIHFWFVRAPDGTVESISWPHLRRLQLGETIEDSIKRRIARKL